MKSKPNILFLMADQMQGRVFEPGHPCLTPNFDRLIARGIRFSRAYTPNPVCSPARASLMTGLLPHNHGVLTVTHTVSEDQSRLRTHHPHWAQHLDAAGYRTGYFGKWHVEAHQPLSDFGWQVSGEMGHGEMASPLLEQKVQALKGICPPTPEYALSFRLDGSTGYPDSIFYGVTDIPPEQRNLGVVTALSLDFLDEALDQDQPWCCFVSVQEPHDPFIAGQAAFDQYEVEAIPLADNVHDDLAGRPGIYRKSAHVWRHMTDRQRREAAACYYASITEIDEQFGRILDQVEQAGQMDNTIVVLTSDHGELLGAHGMYCKNFSAYEEIYNIPLIMAGPDLTEGMTTSARVGLHDLGPTLLDLVGCPPIENSDSQPFAPVLRDPHIHEANYTTGYAEYFGGRMILTQRVVWDGPWKFVFNGFDFDELYNLDEDPGELNNLADQAAHRDRLRTMTAAMWQKIEETGDHSLARSTYPPLRVAPFGPGR
jgi:arylsulfatase A-like enzyme